MADQQTHGNTGLRRTLSDRRGGRRITRKLQTPYPVIPRLKNRIPTLINIKRRGDALFPAGSITGKQAVVPFQKSINANVNTSSLSAWLIRRLSEQPVSQNVSKLLKTIDRDFYDIWKEVLGDKRFSYEEKN
ncbi:hypothetical protein BBW68_06310 [Candidatus Erwinia dacicola]|uniref:Uncharacterized protein n=2 Tax=Candidatus Erwinia dacicola TaxID=252393 RepID=A0A1E7Z3M7_9GAMM|nr:hypothetical protein BBW68_06310 [Candidatus Erwinia dacicola]